MAASMKWFASACLLCCKPSLAPQCDAIGRCKVRSTQQPAGAALVGEQSFVVFTPFRGWQPAGAADAAAFVNLRGATLCVHPGADGRLSLQ